MLGPWGIKIAELKRKISAERETIKNETIKAAGFYHHAKLYSQKVDDHFMPMFATNKNRADQNISKIPQILLSGWNETNWRSWKFDRPTIEDILPSGDFVESRFNSTKAFKVPVYIPFIGSNRTIILIGAGHSNEKCIALLQAIAIRSALMLPHQARFTLLDPAGHGQAFPMSQYLPMVRENTGDTRQDLDSVIRDMRRIISTYLDAVTPSFEQIPEIIRSNEQFEIILAANFPKQYDRRAIEAMQSLGSNGPNAGRYLFVHYNTDHELPRDLTMRDFENALYIDFSRNDQGITPCDLKYKPDSPPPPKLQKELLTNLRMSKPPERILDWDQIGRIPNDDWWTESSQSIIQTPIGGKGTTDILNLWFGVNHDNRPCAHGMIGAMTGAGKSNFYHVFILGLCIRYSPEELRLYLIDGKDGVEFQVYRNLPHAEVVSLRTAPELSRSILTELIAEKERRNSIFAEVGVRDFFSYREKEQPKGKMARILLLVDEYQELFEGDKDGIASTQLLQLSQQGRSAGIHMLLASQRFGAPGMLNQTAIFGNIHLRIAMHMTLTDRQALSEFGREGKHLIETCNLPGKIVVNDHSGDDGGNQLGKVAFLKSDQINSLLHQLVAKAKKSLSVDALPMTVIFDGKEQPNLVDNPQISYLLGRSQRLTLKELEAFARKPQNQGGLDVLDWFWAERPNIIWLGQEFAVRGQTKVIIRRRISENVMFIGDANTVRYGMLSAAICSLAITLDPKLVKFIVIDRSIPGVQWHHTLKTACNSVLGPAGFNFAFSQKNMDAAKLIEKMESELERRSRLQEENLIRGPSIFIILSDPDRVVDLVRQTGEFGKINSPLGEKLKKIFIEGPPLGIHVVISFSDLGAMKTIIDERRDLEFFRHRVALQMNEDRSFDFVRNRMAAMLQPDEPPPIAAIYADTQKDSMIRFKPYSIDATIGFDRQMNKIGNHLKKWRKIL